MAPIQIGQGARKFHVGGGQVVIYKDYDYIPRVMIPYVKWNVFGK
jgi:hypothetical protein